MNFHEEIAHKIYTEKTIIGPTRLYWKTFIEAMQDKAEYKGVTYYSNIISAMPKHFGSNLYPAIFTETLEYCKQRIDEIESGSKPEQLPQPVFNHFRDLFNTPADMEFCINALRTVKPKPVIDENNSYRLGDRKKSVFAAWVNSMRNQAYLKESETLQEIARLLPTIISNLTITEKTLRNDSSVAFEGYADAISSRLNKI